MRTYENLLRTEITPEYVMEKYSVALEKTGLPLMLYIDTPFCMKACKFCNCRPYEAKCGGKEYKEYFIYLFEMLERFKPLLEKYPPSDIYFGGGTPFFMDSPTMESVFSHIPNLKNIPNKVMEGHPGLLNKRKMDLLIENNFSYVSLGIQTFDKDVLNSQNRIGVDFDKTKEKIKYMQDKGIVVNCDLITFLGGVNDEALQLYRRDLELVRELGADTVTCYYDFYKLKTTQYENRQLVEEDLETLNWIRKYRSEMVRFARRHDFKLLYDFKEFLNMEHIRSNPTYTTQVFMTGKRSPHKYSCSGFPNFRPDEIALGLGGYAHHITYGHVGREFNYEMRLTNGKLLLEELS